MNDGFPGAGPTNGVGRISYSPRFGETKRLLKLESFRLAPWLTSELAAEELERQIHEEIKGG